MTAQEEGVLRRWDASPLVTDAQVRNLVGVLRAVVLALAAPEPDKPLAGDPDATQEWQEWNDRRLVALSIAQAMTVDGSGVTQPVSGTFFQATQPVSVAALPLPAGAALETTAQAVDSAVGELAFDSWLRFEETRWS